VFYHHATFNSPYHTKRTAIAIIAIILAQEGRGQVHNAENVVCVDSTFTSVQINQAINNLKGKGIVALKKGKYYRITAPLQLRDSLTLKGEQAHLTIRSGPIIEDSAHKDIVITGIIFEGDSTSWAIHLRGSKNVTIKKCECKNIMLVETEAISIDFGRIDDSGMCQNLIIRDNTGECRSKLPARSIQFIRILFANQFDVSHNICKGYREGILAWGGDGNSSQLTPNGPRKCMNGTISGNLCETRSAGIWASMAKDITIVGNKVKGCAAEAYDFEGCVNIIITENSADSVYEGFTLFGHENRDILFRKNTISIMDSGYAVRNASCSPWPTYGKIIIDSNSFKTYSNTKSPGSFFMGSFGSARITNNIFENIVLDIGSCYHGNLELLNNKISFTLNASAISSIYLVRIGGMMAGFDSLSDKLDALIEGNILEYPKGSILQKRGFFMTDNAPGTECEIEASKNTIQNISEPFSIESGNTRRHFLIYNNIINQADCPYSNHGSIGDAIVVFKDNVKPDGLDVYGSVPTIGFRFSEGSEIKYNAIRPGNPIGAKCILQGNPGRWKDYGKVE
jgi:hypothetical protein